MRRVVARADTASDQTGEVTVVERGQVKSLNNSGSEPFERGRIDSHAPRRRPRPVAAMAPSLAASTLVGRQAATKRSTAPGMAC